MYGIGYASVSAVNDKLDDDDDDDDDASTPHSSQRLAENESMSDPQKRRDQCKYLTCVYMFEICKSVSAIRLFICYKSTSVYQANVHAYLCVDVVCYLSLSVEDAVQNVRKYNQDCVIAIIWYI